MAIDDAELPKYLIMISLVGPMFFFRKVIPFFVRITHFTPTLTEVYWHMLVDMDNIVLIVS